MARPSTRIQTTSRYPSIGARRGRFTTRLRVGWEYFYLGDWPTRRAAAIARDRAILHFELDLPLAEPQRSRGLGPLSPALLRREAIALRKQSKGERSRFVGVCREKSTWSATISIGYRTYWVGGFPTERAAAVARNKMVKLVSRAPPGLGGTQASALVKQLRRLWPGAHVSSWRYADRSPAPRREPAVRPKRPPITRAAPVKRGHSRRSPKSSSERKASHRSRMFGVFTRTGPGGPWIAWIRDPRAHHTVYLGSWPTEQEAALAHDRAALHYHGPQARQLNYPKKAHKLQPADRATLLAEAFQRKKAHTSSRFRGVCWKESAWYVALRVNGKQLHLGCYRTEEEAARAWDRAALLYRGKEATLNFPRIRSQLGRSAAASAQPRAQRPPVARLRRRRGRA